MQTFVSTAEDSEAIPAGPSMTLVRVPGSATGARTSAVEMRIDGGWEGPPPHVHEVVDHLWYVVDGEVTMALRDDPPRTFGPGACAYVPAGVPHTFSTSGTAGVTMLQVDTGQPLDGYFRDLAAAFPPGQPVDRTKVGEIMRRHDTRPVSAGAPPR